jgi:hypothetical protein
MLVPRVKDFFWKCVRSIDFADEEVYDSKNYPEQRLSPGNFAGRRRAVELPPSRGDELVERAKGD